MDDIGYIREKNTDVLGIYTGVSKGGEESLLIVFSEKPRVSFASKLLQSSVAIRDDGRWALKVLLLDSTYIGVFRIFVNDLIEIVKKEKIQIIAERKLVNRYMEWVSLFDSKVKNHLGFKEIQGLLGELLFLDLYLFPKYGAEASIKSWTGPLGNNQDFQLMDSWYEIKTKSINKETISISNQNQLNREKDGKLVVISCEKASVMNHKSISLLEIHEIIMTKINNEELQHHYLYCLAKSGFIADEYYQDYRFEINELALYKVDKKFPYLVDSSEFNAIHNIKYDIYLPNIRKFLFERINDVRI